MTFRWLPADAYLVDVSGWQHPSKCDWTEAWYNGCVGAYVKRSQGRKIMESGAEHARRIADSPAFRGDYHFVDCRDRADLLHPERQADAFCRAIGTPLGDGELSAAIDLEWLNGCEEYPNLDWILAFADYVGERIGSCDVLYTLASYCHYLLPPHPGLACFRLWLANAGSGRRWEPLPLPRPADVDAAWVDSPRADWYPIGGGRWPEWTLYQHSCCGKPGGWYAGNNIDTNTPRRWLATLRDLRVG